MAKFFILLIGLLLGVGAVVVYNGMKPPPGHRRPRPNRKRRDKMIQTLVPVAAAIGLSVLAWVGLSLLFSSDKTARETTAKPISAPATVVHNSVTQKIETNVPDDLGIQVKKTRPVENPLALVQTAEPPVEPISKTEASVSRFPEPEPLPTPKSNPAPRPSKPAVSQAAKWASPKEPTRGQGQLGQALVKSEPEIDLPENSDDADQPIEPKTLAHPKIDAPLTEIFPQLKAKNPADELPNAIPNDGAPAYTVVLGSFSMKSNAERNLARLRSAGVPAFISPANINDRQYFRLMAGRFPSETEAAKYGQKLERNGLTRDTGKYMVKSLDQLN